MKLRRNPTPGRHEARPEMRFCVDCVHHRWQGRTDLDVWYVHRCAAVSSTLERPDPVTGRREAPELRFCRDINTDGYCPGFVKRK